MRKLLNLSVSEQIVCRGWFCRLFDLDVHLRRTQEEHTWSDTLEGTTHAEHHAGGEVHDAICHGFGHTGEIQYDRNTVTQCAADQLSILI